MSNVVIGLWLLLIILIAAAFLLYYFYPAAFPFFWRQANVPNQGVIKRDWVPTGRVDFATTSITKITSNPGDMDQPTEFKLLVEELCRAPSSSNPQTGNAQQRSRHKALMRHTATRCFPSTRRDGRLV